MQFKFRLDIPVEDHGGIRNEYFALLGIIERLDEVVALLEAINDKNL